MKREISPVAAGLLVVAIVAVIGGLLWMRAGGVSHTDEKPPGMPPEAAAALQNIQPSGSGKTAPTGGGVAGVPGGYMAPPKGP